MAVALLTTAPGIRDLSLVELIDACQRETAHFTAGQPYQDAYALELARRAVCDRDDGAWEALVAQYRCLVIAYVRQHPASRSVPETDDFWVGRTFERFWRAVGPEKISEFHDLRALLQYVKLCAHSELMDALRACRFGMLISLDDVPADVADPMSSESAAIGALAGQDLWDTIAGVLASDNERLVAALSFKRGLKPREIFACERGRFDTVFEVYRVKRHVLDRLTNSAEVRSFI
jgi:hypothetical protein